MEYLFVLSSNALNAGIELGLKIMKNRLVVIGMPRGSTTYLYHNLNKHPSIFCRFARK